MKKFSLLFFFLLSFIISFAQDSAQAVRGLRADGKVYVVGAVAITILAGLFIYLIRLDKKISRMEKTLGNDKTNES
jgi:hypothetical protein